MPRTAIDADRDRPTFTDAALDAGGHDNITVAVVPVVPLVPSRSHAAK